MNPVRQTVLSELKCGAEIVKALKTPTKVKELGKALSILEDEAL